jgi:hypothetical protein
VDALAARLLFQPLAPAERAALLAFPAGTNLAPLILDTFANGLR